MITLLRQNPKINKMNHKLQTAYLQAMDIDIWRERNQIEPISSTNDVANPIANLSWQELRQCVADCQACSLHKTRTQTVFGIGNQQTDILFVGEAPGANEDLQGEPFVGRAGKLLDAMLLAIGLKRADIYIANILKCRPPNNRDPQPEEVALCTPYLQRQMQLLQPKLIVALGRIAAHYLLATTTALGKLRGHIHHYSNEKIPLLVTYHPAYLLRSPREKAKAYEDMLKIKSYLQ
jgi:DNA polymerase